MNKIDGSDLTAWERELAYQQTAMSRKRYQKGWAKKGVAAGTTILTTKALMPLVAFLAIMTIIPTAVGFNVSAPREPANRVCLQIRQPGIGIMEAYAVLQTSPVTSVVGKAAVVSLKPVIGTPCAGQYVPSTVLEVDRAQNPEMVELAALRVLLLEMQSKLSAMTPPVATQKPEEVPKIDPGVIWYDYAVLACEIILTPFVAVPRYLSHFCFRVKFWFAFLLERSWTILSEQWVWICDVCAVVWSYISPCTAVVPFTIYQADPPEPPLMIIGRMWAAFIVVNIEIFLLKKLFWAVLYAYYTLKVRGWPIGIRLEMWAFRVFGVPVLFFVKFWTFRFINRWHFEMAPPLVEVAVVQAAVPSVVVVREGSGGGSIVREGPTGTGHVFEVQASNVPKIIRSNQMAIGYQDKKGRVHKFGFGHIVRWDGQDVLMTPCHVVRDTKLYAKADEDFQCYCVVTHLYGVPRVITIDHWKQAVVSPKPDFYAIEPPSVAIGWIQPGKLEIGDLPGEIGEVVSYVAVDDVNGPKFYMIRGQAEKTDDEAKVLFHAPLKPGFCGAAYLSVVNGGFKIVGYHVAYEKFDAPRGQQIGQSHGVRLFPLLWRKRSGTLYLETIPPRIRALMDEWERFARGQMRWGQWFSAYQADQRDRDFVDEDDFVEDRGMTEEQEERLVEEYVDKMYHGVGERGGGMSWHKRAGDHVSSSQKKFGPKKPPGLEPESGNPAQAEADFQASVLRSNMELKAQIAAYQDEVVEMKSGVAAMQRQLQEYMDRRKKVEIKIDQSSNERDIAVCQRVVFQPHIIGPKKQLESAPPKDKEECTTTVVAGNVLSPGSVIELGRGTVGFEQSINWPSLNPDQAAAFLNAAATGFSGSSGMVPVYLPKEPVVPIRLEAAEPRATLSQESRRKRSAFKSADQQKTGTLNGEKPEKKQSWAVPKEIWDQMTQEQRQAHNKTRKAESKAKRKEKLVHESGESLVPQSVYDRRELMRIKRLLRELREQVDVSSGPEKRQLLDLQKQLQKAEQAAMEVSKKHVKNFSDEDKAYIAQLLSQGSGKQENSSLSTGAPQETQPPKSEL